MDSPTPTELLTVRVTGDLLLDLGTAERAAVCCVVHPPSRLLYDQLVTWLDSQPDAKPVAPADPTAGVATALLCIRWGTWFGLLTDSDRRPWEHVSERGVSCIRDAEMARMNIEASSALERWIALLRADPTRWSQLAGRAVACLPWTGGAARANASSPLAVLGDAGFLQRVEGVPDEHLSNMRLRVAENPGRVCANAIINTAWRNGPVEGVHGGRDRGAPLDRRRVTPKAEREILDFASGHLATAMGRVDGTRGLTAAEWEPAVLPFALPAAPWAAPRDWSLTEGSREVVLGGP